MQCANDHNLNISLLQVPWPLLGRRVGAWRQNMRFQDKVFTHPAFFAACSIFATMVVMIVKIVSGRRAYGKMKKARAKVAKKLAECSDLKDEIPEALKDGHAGCGAYLSALVIFVAAVGAIAFCVVASEPLRAYMG